MPGARRLAVASILCFAVCPARALETDQFYAWTRPLDDAGPAISRRIEEEIDEALAGAHPRSCRDAERAIQRHLSYLIMARPELWIVKTTQVQRIPANEDEEETYRRADLYGTASPMDPVLWMPPSPTIEVGGVRFGTDKITHFFTDSVIIERAYRRALKRGATDDDAMVSAVRDGVLMENTVWGKSSSGIFSIADLEANYQGLMFYRGLCEGPAPALAKTPSGWRRTRPFDLARYITPEWDESWEPNIYSPHRWSLVKPVMEGHCAELASPLVVRRRAAYAERDRQTVSEREVLRLVAAGKLDDPIRYSIDAVCGTGVTRTLTPAELPGGSGR